MKTNNIIKKLLTITLSLTALAVTASAKPPVKNNYNFYNSHPLSVKYMGTKKDYLIFKITVRGDNLKNPELFIDESNMGSPLYWKKLPSKTKTQYVKIRKSENLNLNFELVVPNKSYYKEFIANTVFVPHILVSENKDLASNE